MKIIKVLVDEMPSGCKRCNFCVAKMYCSLLEDRKTTVPDEPYKRRADCPLVYDFGDRETNALNKRIAELEEKQRWIPVSEGLPDTKIVYDKFDVIVEFENIENGGMTRCVELMSYDYRNKSWNDDCGEYGFYPVAGVTHWRERPTPPEVQ